MVKKKVLIMGAAGRDFHNFNVYFRDNSDYDVVAFTATQIPGIHGRCYPPELAGKLYPKGIPIYHEQDAAKIIKEHKIDMVVFAYSDLPYSYVMNKSALVNAAGADFVLMGEEHTQIKSIKPVIAVCAVRTGCGKSQVSREIFKILRKKGIRVASIRHPMPYDTDLNMQTVQKFVTYEDLNRFRTTIEEREEYEPYIDMGGIIFSGVDYEKILREAEKEADVIIWDGGNNDFSFYKPDLLITIADPHRAGHEVSYYAGELNFRSADVIIINKINTADRQNIELVRNNATEINPDAAVIMGVSSVSAEGKEKIKGKRVLVIEDGPTVTHGGMPYGAGTVAAEDAGVKEIIDPRPFAVGSIKETFEKYTHLTNVLPAMGYGKKQISELEKTINNADAEYVVSGTPIDITRVLSSSKPILRVKYGVGEETVSELEKIVEDFVKKYL
ncbi:MAG: GTPase [Thermoplasmata archaeon M9B1D]|nr:MAG: GTPase [Thermoplasmata archaeon M9B1D]PNX49989.1 MAG: GTPase [Thermoplasmata archaeon M8B2D]